MNDPALQRRLDRHVSALRACAICPKMQRPAVSGGAILSKVMLIGQAPGVKEPVAGKPFAWTAGRTLFRWFQEFAAVDETQFRHTVYMAAVCRCFPGKTVAGGDRVPDPGEIANCSRWLTAELEILQPELLLPVGKLAIQQFIPADKLINVIGRKFRVQRAGREFDVIPLPHPSGASPWHRMEPGLTLLGAAMRLICAHPAWLRRVHDQAGVSFPIPKVLRHT